MPTLASSNRAAISYIAESVFGTTPGAGTAKNLRFTGESLNFDLSKDASKEIRSDRQVPGTTTVDASANGALNFELSYREYDPFLEAALFSAYTEYGTSGVGATFTADFTTTTITNTGAALSGANAFTVLQPGQWFRLLAPANPNNGKFLRVHATTAPTSTVITLDAATPATAATGVASCAIQASRLTNGTTPKFFSIERTLADVGQYQLFKGMHVNKMNLKFAAGARTDGSFEFLGKNMVRAELTGMPSAPGASQTFEGQNGVTGIGLLWEGTGPLTSTYVKSLDLSIDNALRSQTALGTLGAVGIGVGDFGCSGSAEMYFADGSMWDKFLNDTYTAITVGTKDGDGNGYILTLPRVAITGYKVMAGAKNQDIMASVTFQAFSDDANAVPGLRKTLFLDRVGVVGT
jgi:hypothetical protein